VLLAPLLLSGTADNNNYDLDYKSKSAIASDTTCNTSNHHKNVSLSYSSYWNDLLQKEYRAASDELKEKRQKWSRSRLEASGISLFGASAEPDSEVFGDKIVRVYKTQQGRGGGRLLRDKYSRGDVLVLTPENNFEYPIVPRECLVVDVGDDWLTVAVGPTWPMGLWENRKKNAGSFVVRLDRTAPQAPLKAQRNSLELLIHGNAGEAAFTMAGLLYGGTSHDYYINATREMPSHFASASAPNELEKEVWSALGKAREEVYFNPNQSQMNAIAWALQRRISLIRGPPGSLCTSII